MYTVTQPSLCVCECVCLLNGSVKFVPLIRAAGCVIVQSFWRAGHVKWSVSLRQLDRSVEQLGREQRHGESPLLLPLPVLVKLTLTESLQREFYIQ